MKVYAVVCKFLKVSPTLEYKLVGLFNNKKDAWIFLQNKLEEPLSERFGYELKNIMKDSTTINASSLTGERIVTNSDDITVIHEYYRIKKINLNEPLNNIYMIFYGE